MVYSEWVKVKALQMLDVSSYGTVDNYDSFLHTNRQPVTFPSSNIVGQGHRKSSLIPDVALTLSQDIPELCIGTERQSLDTYQLPRYRIFPSSSVHSSIVIS